MIQIIYQAHHAENSLKIRPSRSFLSLKRFFLFLIIFLLTPFLFSYKVSAAPLDGRILLQVEAKGEAWYVNPLNSSRYYLGRPENAFELMRSLGLGASDKDIGSYQVAKAPARLSGRILLQVQDKGQAFYVNPLDLKLYYLGRPNDAFYLMRSLGLGITNNDLNKIKVAPTSAPVPSSLTENISQNQLPIKAEEAPAEQVLESQIWIKDSSKNFSFKYKNENQFLTLNLSSALYEAYKNSPKVLTYQSNNKPENFRDAFYGIFLEFKNGDDLIKDLVAKGREVANSKNWTEDELLEYLLAFIQYISYDYSKIENGLSTNPFYPYESLYLKKGVCSDKTFLALALVRELGYGGAILDFPDINHSALGLSCPLEYSVRGSGYCFVETTNYFPLGVIPKSIDGGLAVTSVSNFSNLFDDSSLGSIEIYQKSSGRNYNGIYNLRLRVEELNKLSQDLETIAPEAKALELELKLKETQINSMKLEMDEYLEQGREEEYNALVSEFNALANEYNELLKVYRAKIESYNLKAIDYNRLSKEFYQM
ncbi:hypothetical protein JXK06_03095 [Patescibacteria group bacterium]|nr:hypothetical protein [Patescibacteria group bacterium]